MSEYIVVLCTLDDREKAEKFAYNLVCEKLCACVNILPGVKSIYEWQDKIEQSEEVLMLIKTKKELFDELKETIIRHHPYDVPEIIALDVTHGNEEYLKWIDESCTL
jgi:periplasmic divalent cation tolerance protein